MINIGVIGYGYWGPNLVRNFNALDDVQVVAVCDLRPERLDFISRQFPAISTLTKDSGDILDSTAIDAVVISTPVSTHFHLASKALENGKHVFLEKPFTEDTSANGRLTRGSGDNLRSAVCVRISRGVKSGQVRRRSNFLEHNYLGDSGGLLPILVILDLELRSRTPEPRSGMRRGRRGQHEGRRLESRRPRSCFELGSRISDTGS